MNTKKIIACVIVFIATFIKAEDKNTILESQIKDGISINVKSFANTNFLYKKCFTEITNSYFKTSKGIIFSKRLSLHRMRVVQHIGYCEYIVDVDEWEPHGVSSWNEYDKDDSPSGRWKNIGWHKVNFSLDNLADNEIGKSYGYPSDEIYEYTTVMGATKRIKVFKSFSEKDMLPITFDDILNHLKEGRSFMINFKHLAITYGKPWQKTSFNVFIVKNGGKFVVFGK